MDKKEHTTNTCNINSDFKYNMDEHFNLPKDYWDKFAWCQYLLPCGLCEKTMQQCPKYQPNKLFITFDSNIGGSSND